MTEAEGVTRERGRLEFFTVVLKTWGLKLADFRGNLVPRSGQQGDETVEPVGVGSENKKCGDIGTYLIKKKNRVHFV